MVTIETIDRKSQSTHGLITYDEYSYSYYPLNKCTELCGCNLDPWISTVIRRILHQTSLEPNSQLKMNDSSYTLHRMKSYVPKFSRAMPSLPDRPSKHWDVSRTGLESVNQIRGSPKLLQSKQLIRSAIFDSLNYKNAPQQKMMQEIRTRLLRVLMRIGSSGGKISQKVLNYLDDGEQRINPSVNKNLETQRTDTAIKLATMMEADNDKASIMTITVLCIGLAGSGKSSTIWNIIWKNKHPCSLRPNRQSTGQIDFLTSESYGVKWTFIDTPGMHTGLHMKLSNQQLLKKIKAAQGKHNPDNCAYFDRLDYARREKADFGVFKSISDVLGNQFFLNSLIIFTHACTSPTEGINGQVSFENIVQQRYSMIEQGLRLTSASLTRPMGCFQVENHPLCRKDKNGFHVLPNEIAWLPELLTMFVACSILKEGDKIISRAATKKKSQNELLSILGYGNRPPLPNLLQQLMAPHEPRKAPDEERDIKSEKDIAKMKDQPLERKKAVMARKNYIRQKAEESLSPSARLHTFAPAPELPLPGSFENTEINLHRYRYEENQAGWITRPQVNFQANEHSDGLEGVVTERLWMLRPPGKYIGGLPSYCNAVVQKGKQNAAFQGEVELTTGLDVIPFGEDVLETTKLTIKCLVQLSERTDVFYILRGDTHSKMPFRPRDKFVLGVFVSRLSQAFSINKGPWACGSKIEYRAKMDENLAITAGAGTGYARGSFGHKQTAKACRVEIKKQINRRHLIESEIQTLWFQNDHTMLFAIEHKMNCTKYTHCTTKLQGGNKGTGTFGIKITSNEKPDLAIALLIPVVGFIHQRIRGQDLL
eukprot:gnl/MRDRNA2_/MRDRNA2_86329_c0_seq1.p1 gnl/MRDRNA2_/MRDRNA2_86329_c0~~gnl/MRDRNA2_/MRDRNA2_86329_c0_seq1.p1  ORF type:complete len:822 (+),score=18.39 gnl/MRDRNA2_/MRDRNA2_86329_c0_seq1:18-2483(+)